MCVCVCVFRARVLVGRGRCWLTVMWGSGVIGVTDWCDRDRELTVSPCEEFVYYTRALVSSF